jgi:hypothetical protein
MSKCVRGSRSSGEGEKEAGIAETERPIDRERRETESGKARKGGGWKTGGP